MWNLREKKKVLGIIEPVSFPGLGISEVLAKIDTGAYSGAIHCDLIEEVTDSSTGEKMLRVVPIDSTYEPVIIRDYARVHARSSTGHREARYIATVQIKIAGKTYEIRIGLTRRKIMKVKVLIGRRFMRANNMLVDVNLNKELDLDGGGKE